MNIYIEYLHNIYIIPTYSYETYEMAYERGWWIAYKQPKNENEFKNIIQDSLQWSYTKYFGVKYS